MQLSTLEKKSIGMSSKRTTLSVSLVGILNITADSFSDGERYLQPADAVAHGLALAGDGADIIDIGAESSNPEGQKISAREEIARLTPVVTALKQGGIPVSVDTYKPEVMRHVISLGADLINDITGLNNEQAVRTVQEANIPVVIMFSRNTGPRAQKCVRDHRTVMTELKAFFEKKIDELQRAGIPGENIIIDPGMGFFLGGNPEPSLTVLRHISELKAFNKKVFISVSRKSFIGTLLNKPVTGRDTGTLTAELWAYLNGVDYIRTHEPGRLRDALTLLHGIKTMR
jgi:dihydropteroate synthase